MVFIKYNENKNRTKEKRMLNEKICNLREQLNESIVKEMDYQIIYELSIELDELIAQYYEKGKK